MRAHNCFLSFASTSSCSSSSSCYYCALFNTHTHVDSTLTLFFVQRINNTNLHNNEKSTSLVDRIETNTESDIIISAQTQFIILQNTFTTFNRNRSCKTNGDSVRRLLISFLNHAR